MEKATLRTKAGCYQYWTGDHNPKVQSTLRSCCHLLAICKAQLLNEPQVICELRASENLQGRASIHQVNADSDIALVLSMGPLSKRLREH